MIKITLIVLIIIITIMIKIIKDKMKNGDDAYRFIFLKRFLPKP